MGKHKKRKHNDEEEMYCLFKKFAKKMRKRSRTPSSELSDQENDDRASNKANKNLQIEPEVESAPEAYTELTVESDLIPVESDSIPEMLEPSPEVVDELDEDILSMLGEDPNKKTYSGPIHKDIATRWNHISVNGIEKEVKTELYKLYPLPENCIFLEAPQLNAEIKAAVSDQVLKRDKAMEQHQSSLGQATACIGKALDILIKTKESKEATNILSDAGRILCDLFHSESMSRRHLLQFALNKNTKDIVSQTTLGRHLFGEKLNEDLKAGKAINKTGSEIKYNNQANKPTRPANLNSRGPPRRYRPYTPSAGNQSNNRPQPVYQRWPAPQRAPAPHRWPAPLRKSAPPQKKI